ncbi:hypothetical protein HWD06_gp068 [Mycobacterium phage Cornie]|uniref:Uncharacterized protein n=1 Tax=Mycobacterium phage Cornie TaxID=2704043 RepID=A0A6G6XKZ6_9CAUD|nr:hypothetical protein HWD06_gp068 [Mycobacterium phage Cornie]QIG58443.1 hypothetical protein SEA_CORNIE_68 [Mycobacterium phage Cornie]
MTIPGLLMPPQCRVRMGVNRDDMNTYTICLCPGFEGTEDEEEED